MFAQIASFNKQILNPVTTQVRTTHVVQSAPQSNYSKQNERDMTEYWDKPQVFRENIKKLAQLIRDSKHLVIYTGAGISTSASIPDYRGENGLWTKADRGEKPPPCKDLAQALPTPAHMIIRSLMDAGICKFVVSTNIDGLHRSSGIPADKIAELHGNCFKEYCKKCNKEYLRYFNCTNIEGEKHQTGRTCDDCGEPLFDNIINFQESLPPDTYKAAEDYSKQADVSLVLGTSMLVAPANGLPLMNPDNKLVIVNRQKTPFDAKSQIRIFGDTDDVLLLLAEELGIQFERNVGGFDISVPEVEHDKKFEQFKPKLEEMKAETEKRLTRKSGKLFIENVKGEKRTVTSSDIGGGSLIFLENCEDLECTIECMPAKVILHNLKNCHVNIKRDILTSCLEMIHCENVIVEICKAVRTISIDKSSKCTLRFSSVVLMDSVYCCQVEDISIAPKYTSDCNCVMKIEIPECTSTEEDAYDTSVPQYITRMYGDNLLTEKVIREGVGYATTVREKTEADAREAKLLAALERTILSDIQSKHS